jgi:hypothetical protein
MHPESGHVKRHQYRRLSYDFDVLVAPQQCAPHKFLDKVFPKRYPPLKRRTISAPLPEAMNRDALPYAGSSWRGVPDQTSWKATGGFREFNQDTEKLHNKEALQ